MGFMVSRPGQFNRYSYCYNDPVNCTDPTGMLPPEGTVSGELFSGHSLEHAQGISDAFAPASEAGFNGMVTGLSLVPAAKGAQIGTGVVKGVLAKGAAKRAANKAIVNKRTKGLRKQISAHKQKIKNERSLGVKPEMVGKRTKKQQRQQRTKRRNKHKRDINEWKKQIKEIKREVRRENR